MRCQNNEGSTTGTFGRAPFEWCWRPADPSARLLTTWRIHAGTLGTWVARERIARGDRLDPTKVDPERVRQLERENAELRMERDVLKRSVVLWVKEATR